MELGGEFSRLTLGHGCKCMPEESVSIEDVLVAISEQVGGGLNIKSASRMNKALVIFLKEVSMVDELLEKGLVVNNIFLPVLPLSNPSKKVVLSNVPPFIKEETLKEILERYGKLTAPIKMIPLGLKNPNMKHVMSFRRFTYMIPNSQHDPLNLVLKVSVGGKDYTIFVSSGQMRCFSCGEHGHVRQTCPTKQNDRPITDLTGSQTIQKDTVQENTTVVREVPAEETENSIGENESRSETNNPNVDVDQSADGASTSANAAEMQNVRSEVQETHSQPKSREEELPSMECVDKNENKSDDEVNENCSQFTVSSGVAMSDCDSDNECESIESFLETGDNDPLGPSELSGCEVKFYSVKQISTFLDETKSVRNPQIEQAFPDLRKFLASCRDVMINTTVEEFSRQKRYRLKKNYHQSKEDDSLRKSVNYYLFGGRTVLLRLPY